MKPAPPTAAILDCLSDGVFMTDPAGRVTWANPALGRLYGIPSAEIVGRVPVDLLAASSGDPDAAHRVENAVTGQQYVEAEFAIQRGGAVMYWARMALNPVTTRRGVFRGFVGTVRDVTDLLSYTRSLEDEVSRLFQILVEIGPSVPLR